MPCNQVGGYELLNPSLLYWKMEAEDLSQTLISRFQTVQCHIPEDHSLNSHHHEYVKS